jgi:hypothetical protein
MQRRPHRLWNAGSPEVHPCGKVALLLHGDGSKERLELGHHTLLLMPSLHGFACKSAGCPVIALEQRIVIMQNVTSV